MGLRTILTTLTLAATAHWSPCAARDVVLETRTWPEAKACSACLTLQFGVLEMRLPTSLIGKIFISGSEPYSLHLLPNGGNVGRESVHFMSSPRVTYVGKYQTLGLPSADSMPGKEFFELLGSPTPAGNPVEKIRRIEGIDVAERYVKTSKEKVDAYWIQAPSPSAQYLHFVIDGNDTIYTLAGTITPQMYTAILEGLTIRPEP